MEEFTVALFSNENSDWVAFNTNYSFGNIFPHNRSLRNYECALESLTYYDRFSHDVEPPPIPPPSPPKPVNFYNTDRGDDKIRVETVEFIELIIKKKSPEFGAFLGDTTGLCVKRGMHVKFSVDYANLEIKAVHLNSSAPTPWHVRISPSLAAILGFERTTFDAGKTKAPHPPDFESFNNIPLNEVVGSIFMAKRVTVDLKLEQVQGIPTLNTILSDIITVLGDNNIGITNDEFRLRKSSKTVQWNLGEIRIQLSNFLNKYMGKDSDFIFEGTGLFTVPDSIIYPPDPSFPEPIPITPNVSCGKLLVTCDIIKSQIVAGREKKVLSILERRESNELVRHHYEAPILLYKEVERPFVSQIRIGLQTDNNSFLDYTDRPTTCILHFRKRLVE